MTYTVELYTQGSPTPVAVMHGCTYIYGDPFFAPAMHKDEISYGFQDADGKRIRFTGLNALIREE